MTTKELYTKLEGQAPLDRCPVCGSPAELWQYSPALLAPSTKVGMCTNGDQFGPQLGIAGIVDSGCLLYMPPDDFYRPTIREAAKYWNEYAKALERLQRKNRWATASVCRNGLEKL